MTVEFVVHESFVFWGCQELCVLMITGRRWVWKRSHELDFSLFRGKENALKLTVVVEWEWHAARCDFFTCETEKKFKNKILIC